MQDWQEGFDRLVFYVSDGTGITAETFGHSVLTQFEGISFKTVRLPFVNSADSAKQAVERVNQGFIQSGKKPIVFSTLVNPDINNVMRQARSIHMDIFQKVVEPLEVELGVKSTHTVGRSHTVAHSQADKDRYQKRIEAINFALAHDDGVSDSNLNAADVILVGVSRSGKTPTSLYLAMQHSIKAANCPLIPEDFARQELPSTLKPYRKKLFGLSISPQRLSEVRFERRPNSIYASLPNCQAEVAAAEQMMRREGIPWFSTTAKSIEEIATNILNELDRQRG